MTGSENFIAGRELRERENSTPLWIGGYYHRRSVVSVGRLRRMNGPRYSCYTADGLSPTRPILPLVLLSHCFGENGALNHPSAKPGGLVLLGPPSQCGTRCCLDALSSSFHDSGDYVFATSPFERRGLGYVGHSPLRWVRDSPAHSRT